MTAIRADAGIILYDSHPLSYSVLFLDTQITTCTAMSCAGSDS
jgi:hypothetical protein